MKILIVDDDPFILQVLGTMLKSGNHDFQTCPSVDAAIERLSSGAQYDLIITDLLMPGKTGMDFISYLKKMKIRIPVVAITGRFDENGIEDYVNIGEMYADATLVKPVSRDNLLNTIKSMTANASGTSTIH